MKDQKGTWNDCSKHKTERDKFNIQLLFHNLRINKDESRYGAKKSKSCLQININKKDKSQINIFFACQST